MAKVSQIMNNVIESIEGLPVKCCEFDGDRLIIEASSQCGLDTIQIDAKQLLEWFAKNKPAVYMNNVTSEMIVTHT